MDLWVNMKVLVLVLCLLASTAFAGELMDQYDAIKKDFNDKYEAMQLSYQTSNAEQQACAIKYKDEFNELSTYGGEDVFAVVKYYEMYLDDVARERAKLKLADLRAKVDKFWPKVMECFQPKNTEM